MLINEIKKFEKYKIYIIIFLIFLFSIICIISYSDIFLVILIDLDIYFIIITIISIKYKEKFIQNKGLTLAIYQNKISPYIFETNENLEIFKLESNIDMELYLKIKILYYNNNFKLNDISEVEKLIKDKNIFYLLYSEIIDVLYLIKNDIKYNYKFDNIYKNKYLIDNKFFKLQKAIKEKDINSIKKILPYRYRIIID